MRLPLLLIGGALLLSSESAGQTAPVRPSGRQYQLQQNIARIYFTKTFGRGYAGTAFLLNNGILVTCAHNVRRKEGYVDGLNIKLRDKMDGVAETKISLSGEYLARNIVSAQEFIYPQKPRHRLARSKYDFAFIKLPAADLARVQSSLTVVSVSANLPSRQDSLFLLGYPGGELTFLAVGSSEWALAPEPVEPADSPPTRTWYRTQQLGKGASGSPLFQVQHGQLVLVGVHTDGAGNRPYQPGDATTGVATWERFYAAYAEALQKPGQ